MKQLFLLLLGASLLGLSACRKTGCGPASHAAPDYGSLVKSGSGSGGSGGGGSTTGPIQNFLSGTASRLVGTMQDSLFVSLKQPAPAGGYTINVTSSNPAAAQVPATVFIPAGAWSTVVPVIGGNVASTATVTITVSLSGQSKTSTIKVYPLNFTFNAPSLQSPSNGSSHNFHVMITFQWAANANAYYSELQISSFASFSSLIYNFYVSNNLYPLDYFWDPATNTSTGLRYWRVRYLDGAGNPGPWSATRTFTVKPQ